MARQRPKDLFKPLRVHFIGEDGIDAGGVKKEFFQLLVTELLSPDYGMLVFQPVRTLVPPPCQMTSLLVPLHGPLHVKRRPRQNVERHRAANPPYHCEHRPPQETPHYLAAF